MSQFDCFYFVEGSECSHLSKGINVAKVRKVLKVLKSASINECSMCKTSEDKSAVEVDEDGVNMFGNTLK